MLGLLAVLLQSPALQVTDAWMQDVPYLVVNGTVRRCEPIGKPPWESGTVQTLEATEASGDTWTVTLDGSAKLKVVHRSRPVEIDLFAELMTLRKREYAEQAWWANAEEIRACGIAAIKDTIYIVWSANTSFMGSSSVGGALLELEATPDRLIPKRQLGLPSLGYGGMFEFIRISPEKLYCWIAREQLIEIDRRTLRLRELAKMWDVSCVEDRIFGFQEEWTGERDRKLVEWDSTRAKLKPVESRLRFKSHARVYGFRGKLFVYDSAGEGASWSKLPNGPVTRLERADSYCELYQCGDFLVLAPFWKSRTWVYVFGPPDWSKPVWTAKAQG